MSDMALAHLLAILWPLPYFGVAVWVAVVCTRLVSVPASKLSLRHLLVFVAYLALVFAFYFRLAPLAFERLGYK